MADLRALWLPLTILGAVFALVGFLAFHRWDLHAYWMIDQSDLYGRFGRGVGGIDVFLYSPAAAALLAPLSWFSWPAAQVLWFALQLGCLYLIGGRWALALVVFPPVWLDIVFGNINIMLAAVIVVGFRWPGVWAFALLTKVTPAVGLVWYAVRREWRPLATVATIAAVSVVLVPHGWAAWIATLDASRKVPHFGGTLPVSIMIRLPLAALLVAWGGLTDRRWTVSIGVTLAMPILWPIQFATLASLVGTSGESVASARQLEAPRPLTGSSVASSRSTVSCSRRTPKRGALGHQA